MKRTGPWRTALLFLLLTAVLAAGGRVTGLFPLFENLLQDSLYQHTGAVSPNIFVIGIDEETLSELGPFETWSRAGCAMLIQALTGDPGNAPAVIGLDIGFYGEKDPVGDARLADACRAAGNVVVAASATFGMVLAETPDGGHTARLEVVTLETPYPALSDAVAYGHTNVNLDADGVVRSALGALSYQEDTVPSFAEMLYLAYTGKASSMAESKTGEWRIAFSGAPYAYYGPAGAGASFVRVLRGEYPAAAFRGAVVLIGAYASGMMDAYDTPVSHGTRMHGVEIHANLLEAMLNNKVIRTLPLWAELLLCAVLWAVALFLLLRLRPLLSLPRALLLTGGYALVGYLLSFSGLFLPLAMPVSGLAALIVLCLSRAYVIAWRDKRRLIAGFSRYLPPEVARSVAEHGEDALRLGGAKRDIAVLFVDIRGFTPLSERMSPEALVSLLNRYLHLTTSCVFRQGGAVDKFIGDATMALFNAPQTLPDYTFHAVCAAHEMVQKSAELNRELAAEGFDGIGFGVGIHTGEAVVGNIGTTFRMDYTAIGDTVNTAARLEGQAKAGEVIISEAVYEQVKDRVECTYMGTRQLKGKRGETPVWRVEAVREQNVMEGVHP